jgi:hypothetical protein
MAKEDFCFTYYDGDAARDTTHMNRLERGAYHDVIISQRKFGHLTLDQIKKILGKDFNECWPALELIMKVEGEKYFVEWLENSIVKMRKHSKKQSANKKGKTKQEPDSTKQQPNNNQTNPLGDGNGNEDGYVIGFKEKEPKEILSESEIVIDPQDDETLIETKMWTEDVVTGNDYRFKKPSGLDITAIHALARDHLGKCSRYGWHKNFTSQQAFRESLLNYINENASKLQSATQKDTLSQRKAKFDAI